MAIVLRVRTAGKVIATLKQHGKIIDSQASSGASPIMMLGACNRGARADDFTFVVDVNDKKGVVPYDLTLRQVASHASPD